MRPHPDCLGSVLSGLYSTGSSLRQTRRRDDATTRRRDDATTRRRDDATTRRRDDATTRRRDDATTRRLDDATTRRRDDATTRRHDDTTTRRPVSSESQLVSAMPDVAATLSCCRRHLPALLFETATTFGRVMSAWRDEPPVAACRSPREAWLEAGYGTLSARGKSTRGGNWARPPAAASGRRQAGIAEGRQKRHCFVSGETARNNDSPVVTYCLMCRCRRSRFCSESGPARLVWNV